LNYSTSKDFKKKEEKEKMRKSERVKPLSPINAKFN
jgi:hypothetical protein